MVLTKEKDFIEIDYTGRIKSTNQIFDVTSAELAKSEGLYKEDHHFGSRIICLGLSNILPALDKFLLNKETGKSYSIELKPEEAFGIKNFKLVKVVPLSSLRENNINPFPGLRLNASGGLGVVKSVSGGRVVIDFNHPLASKDIIYEISIKKIVTDEKLKVSSLVQNILGLHDHDFEIKIENTNLEIKVNSEIPVESKKSFIEKVKDLIPTLQISFT